jgi:threonine aldolase
MFVGAQMSAYLKDGHWLVLARHANAMADRLAQGLATCPGVRLPWPTQANEVFAILPRAADAALKAAGALYYHWGNRGLTASEAPQSEEVFVRLVPSFATKPQEVDRFLEIVRTS